jgi:hypothetical protein
MRRFFIASALVLLVSAALPAFEAAGTVQKVDVEKGVVSIRADGKDRTVPVDKAVTVLDQDGRPLPGGLAAKELKEGIDVVVTVDTRASGPVITAIRLGTLATPPPQPRASVGLTPLTDMTATDRYKGEDGGLYGNGRNQPPAVHLEAARAETVKIAPLDAEGRPSPAGTIALVSISMSNATQEFALFKQIADADPMKSPRVTIVDCAQNGQAMAQWVHPAGHPWAEADRRLDAAGVSAKQVQVAWVKLANIQPSGDLADHGKILQRDTTAVLQNAKTRFPNLRVAYLGSRIYGGWTAARLNPEPYAYEGAFVVRWMIRDQIAGDAALNYSSTRGAVKAPLLLWGPYLWADGTRPRNGDGLTYERGDLADDGTHPSPSGRRKVADMLLTFFQTDSLARTWYSRK